MKVRLTRVDGNQEDFADLLGATGILEDYSDGPCFRANGEWLSLMEEDRQEDASSVVISTELGNKFYFQKAA